jgi:hypothetical protein
VIEIRSYRRVFELERRIYRIDRLRLNPAGVPVRGIVYFLVLSAAGMLLAATPLAAVAGPLPWYLRSLLLPGGAAALLTVIRLDGRSFHVAARALLRSSLEPRSVAKLEVRALVAAMWHPPEIVLLPDGSDGRLRKLLYRGPGAVLVTVEHERVQGDVGRHGWLRRWSCRGRALAVRELPRARVLAEGRVILLARGARLSICPHETGPMSLERAARRTRVGVSAHRLPLGEGRRT